MWLHSINHREWPGVSFFLNVFVINRVVLPVGDFISARKKAFVSYFLQKVPAWQRSARYNVCSLVWLYIYGPISWKNPGPGPLQWITDPATSSGTLLIRSPLGGIRYVVRVLHKGLWLPGWGTFFATRIAGPDGAQFVCRSNIQFINSSDKVPYHRVSFSVGDPVPALAIVTGYWPNGTPLYITQLVVSDASSISPTYYNADSLQIRPMFSNVRPKDIRIFVRRVYRYGSMIQCTGKQVKLVNSCKLTCSPTARSLWSPDRSNEHKLLVEESLGC